MDIDHLGTKITIILVAVAGLWLFLKTMKILWKLIFIIFIFLAISFALPSVRAWMFSFFR